MNHSCIFHGYTVMNAGAKGSILNHKEQAPLHLAAKQGKEEIVKFLIEKKADCCSSDDDGNTPLNLAAKGQHEGVVNILLEHSKDAEVEHELKARFIFAMQSKYVTDAYLKDQIRAMSPLRYDPRMNASCSDCMLFTLLSSWYGPSQCGQFVQV